MRSFDFEKTPVTDILNDIIIDAVNKGASDIHFDPSKKDLVIRLRIDGDLMDYAIVPLKNKNNITTRIKVIANMNITETRLPQDGAIKREINNKLLDLRVSSLPTNVGEKIVIRILDYSKSFQGLETLGFSEAALEKVYKLCKIPSGIILVTGATGTGKSTTVYSILQKMNTEKVNIITVEDPVEMDLPRVNQVQVQPEIGLDFASVLRSILRQDPNIIMVGEIRDNETAKIAVRASITGHIVLSTVHTNNSLNTIERLTDMEVERYLLGSALMGIISQRLAKKLCPKCKILVQTSEYEKNAFRTVLHKEVNQIYKANKDGCQECINGYKGRIAILEVLTITEAIRDAIIESLPKEQLRDLVYKGDVISLLEDGLEKVVQGLTSFEEIVKIIDLEDDIATTDSDALKKNLSQSSEISQKENEEFEKKNQEEKNVMNQTPVQNINQNTNIQTNIQNDINKNLETIDF